MILFRFFVAGLLLYLLWRLLRFRPGSHSGRGTARTKKSAESPEEMKQDPVCGTWVPVSQAVSVNHQGTPLYFCSPNCREQFLKENPPSRD